MPSRAKFYRPLEEIEKIRTASSTAASVLKELCDKAEVGMSTYDLDQLGKKLIEEAGAQSACYQYKNGRHVFPSYTCLSLNEEIVHGIGRLERTIQDGDILTIDVSILQDGFIGDNARTIIFGNVPEPVKNLVDCAQEALELGLKFALPGNRVGEISYSIFQYVRSRGFGVVRDFVGHGVGKTMHEPPQIPNFGKRRQGIVLQPGMALAIEPMITLGSHHVEFLDDHWTAVTRDGKASAHFEHTVLVTESEPEVLTRRNF